MMMVHKRVARRYARALKELAHERGGLDKIEAELQRLVQWLREDELFRRVWEHRRVSKADKRRLIDGLPADQISPLTRHFLYLLVEKRRESILEAVASEFTLLANEVRAIVDVEVQTPRALGAEERELLSRRISEYVGKQVRLIEVTVPELIGGVVARVGDLVMDGSVLTRLQRLRQHLLRGTRLPDEG